MSVPVAQLSCQQCQRRKTKCNKQVPCSACVKAEISCTAVQRHRLPRGRSGKHKPQAPNAQAVTDRIARLEALVAQLQDNGGSEHASLINARSGSQCPAPSEATPVESLVAPAFWQELSDAVSGLRDVLENPDEGGQIDDDYSVPSPNTSLSSPGSTNGVDTHNLLFSSASTSPKDPSNLPPGLIEWLPSVYEERVHPIFKPIHWPSALAIIRPSGSKVHNVGLDVNARALEAAIHFTAACSLQDKDLADRPSIIYQLQQAVEHALARAKLLTTTEFVVLQAFVIYLVGLRVSSANALQWTLVPTAIRIASAQGIPDHLSGSPLTLELEMRRRLWFCINLLDLQSAFDRGTKPLLQLDQFEHWPTNANDIEMSPASPIVQSEFPKDRFTENSFHLACTRGALVQRRLSEISYCVTGTDEAQHARAVRDEQLKVFTDYEQFVQQIPNAFDSPPTDIQKYTVSVVQEQFAAMQLILHRPLHRCGLKVVPPNTGPFANFDLLTTATRVLEHSNNKDGRPEFAKYAWFAWPKWYALAVVLAELCTAQGPYADRAWEISKQSYKDYAHIVADSKGGLLWKPIVKLMRKVEARRGVEPGQSSMSSALKPTQNDIASSGHTDPFWTATRNRTDLDQTSLAPTAYDETMLGPANDMSWSYWNSMLEDFGNDSLWNGYIQES